MRTRIAIAVTCLLMAYGTEASAREVERIVLEPAVPLQPSEQLDFVFISTSGVVTRQSVGDPDGDGRVSIPVPTDADVICTHIPQCSYVCDKIIEIPPLAPTSGPRIFLRDQSAGISLLPGFDLTDFPTVPRLSAGDTFEVVNGVADQLPAAAIRAPGLSWFDITDAQWADAQQVFPLFTGTAVVEEVVQMHVVVNESVPAVSGWGMGVIVLLLLVTGWVILKGRFASRRSAAE